MSDDVEMLGVRVPSELKRLLDADERTNQEIVEAALWREFGGERRSALERRIEEKQRRMSMIESERNERERELEEMERELAALQSKLDSTDTHAEKIVAKAVGEMGIPPNVGHDHAAARNWAEKANLPVEEFWSRYTEAYDE